MGWKIIQDAFFFLDSTLIWLNSQQGKIIKKIKKIIFANMLQ